MKEFLTLRVLDRLKPLFLKAGIDYVILRRILQVKLTMDQRRTSAVSANPTGGGKPTYIRKGGVLKRTKSESSPISMKSLWVYGLIGAIGITPFLLLGDNYMFQMGLVFTIILFFLITTIVSDFSSVLLDLKDRHILHTKPVDARTLATAKTVHILCYLVSLTASLTFIPLLVSLFRQGLPFFLLFLLELIAVDVFVVVATALMYLLVLKFFDGEKLKDVINYVQIGLSVALMAGYQIMFRVLDFIHFGAGFTVRWWHFPLPPFWFAAPFQWLLHGDSRLPILILSALALIVPILCAALYIRLGSSFERYLQKMADSGKYDEKRKSSGRPLSLGRLICRSREEAILYDFAARMMSREREFKLKVYPTLGLGLIFPYIFILNNLSNSSWATLSGSSLYLFIYFSALFMPSVVTLLRYSGNYKGSYIYRTVPLKDLNAIHKGSIKAAVTRLFLPLFLLDGIVFLFIFGLRILPDLLVVLLVVILYTVIIYRMEGRALPFSESFGTIQQTGMGKALPALFILGAFAGLHYAAGLIPFGIYGYAAVLALANIAFWHKGFKRIRTIS